MSLSLCSLKLFKINFKFSKNSLTSQFNLSLTAPSPGTHQLRTFNLNHQRILDTPYLRDLSEPFRRRSLSQLNTNSSNQTSNNTNVPALECSVSGGGISGGGYKPNAPQIQGKYFTHSRDDFLMPFISLTPNMCMYNLG